MITREELIERASMALWSFEQPLPWSPVVEPVKDKYRASAILVIRIALEAAAEAVRAETIEEPQDDSDDAYNLAVTHAMKAIRALIPENDHD